MDNLILSFQKYLQELLGIFTTPANWEGEKSLPYFLRDTYRFYEASILGVPCLLMVAQGETEKTPATIRKNANLLQNQWEGLVIFVSEVISTYNRKRLIEANVPFVIPANQMFVPQLGIALQERLRRNRNTLTHTQFSPSTAVVVLYALLRDNTTAYTPSLLAHLLGYTRMTLTRALNEIGSAGIGEVETKGKERILIFPSNRHDLWKNAEKFMRSPVKKRLWVNKAACEQQGAQAGLTALSKYSMIAPPAQPVYAIDAHGLDALKNAEKLTKSSPGEPDGCELEIWNYSPKLFAQNNLVDPFSLYLSLREREDEDERVEEALADMMEKIAW